MPCANEKDGKERRRDQAVEGEEGRDECVELQRRAQRGGRV